MNVGEEIAGEWLRRYRGCTFVNFNVYPNGVQGEIDVIGMCPAEPGGPPPHVYICEVAIHLATGLNYHSNGNVKRLTRKFITGITYARTAFPNHQVTPMLWSPIVKSPVYGKRNQLQEVVEIQEQVRATTGLELDLIINEKYLACVDQLRTLAASLTEEIKSPILRLMQIEELTRAHVKRTGRRLATAVDQQRATNST